MNLYEVIFYEKDDEDTIYLVRAPDFMAAVESVSDGKPCPDVVYEIGVDASAHAEATGPCVLRGPYNQPAHNFAWKSWQRKITNGEHTGEWEEVPYNVA